MKKILLLILLLSQAAFAQLAVSRYEAEMLKNPNKNGKDTREVNAVLVFEKEILKIVSRRSREVFKEYKYTAIKYVEHSYSKAPVPSVFSRSRLLAGILFSDPMLFPRKEKHWLTILTEEDFVVLKIENDNYRLLKMEFLVRDLDLVELNEDRQ
jgi:ATP sulfurylase